MPLFIRAGSIIPFGPELQYTGEKPADPITLYVYAGADGAFTLYEDDGLTYGYEKGAFARIPIGWDDAAKTLTLGKREGQRLGGVIRTNRKCARRRLFSAVGLAVVFVKRERAVSARINIQRNRVRRFLAGVLQFRAERNDGPGADEQRQRVIGRRGVNGLSAPRACAGPEIVPVTARWWQIDTRLRA